MLILCLSFVAFFFLFSSVSADDDNESTSFYCCESDTSAKATCSLGGCQYALATLQSFHSVSDCSQCKSGAVANNTVPATYSSVCSFCAVSGDHCVEQVTVGSSFGCAQSDETRPLVEFRVNLLDANGSTVGLIPQSFCCYYRAFNQTEAEAAAGSYQLQEGTGGCPFGDAGLSLVAFAEHDFDFACPARPPCEADCHGNGLCAGSQCVCRKHYYGDTCDTRCDRTNCVNGRCYNDPNRAWPPTTTTTTTKAKAVTPSPTAVDDDIEVMFDDSYDAAFADDNSERTASPACHCSGNYVGLFCDKCARNYNGPNCTDFCVGAPCEGQHMTGNCQVGGCECEHGYMYDAAAKACVCRKQSCNLFGQCNANGTCECAGHWNGTGCSDCTCENGGTCSPKGVCVCPSNFGGDACEKCNGNYFDVSKNCSTFCLDHTTFNVTYNGSDTFYPPGMCHHRGLCNGTTGACDCPANAVGEHCEACEPFYFGESCNQYCFANTTCGGLGTCNNGTGLCDCFKTGFGGNCTTCLPNYYPAGACTTMCDSATTCNYNGHCDANGLCVCKNTVIFNEGDCSVQIWVIIVPCVAVIALLGGFVYYLWKKKKATDEFGEPLLGSGW
jgi:hypothetical protein